MLIFGNFRLIGFKGRVARKLHFLYLQLSLVEGGLAQKLRFHNLNLTLFSVPGKPNTMLSWFRPIERTSCNMLKTA